MRQVIALWSVVALLGINIVKVRIYFVTKRH